MPRKRRPRPEPEPDLFLVADEREDRERVAKRTPAFLTPRQCKIGECYAHARSLLALEYARQHLGGEAPSVNWRSVKGGGVEVHRPGVYGEYTGHKLTGLPWVPVHHGPIPRNAPDLGDFVDVKCRAQGDHLCIHRDKKIIPDRIYVQCYSGIIDRDAAMQEGWAVSFAGWIFGRDILKNYSISHKFNTGRPAWWIPEADLRLMGELLEMSRRGGPLRVVQ